MCISFGNILHGPSRITCSSCLHHLSCDCFAQWLIALWISLTFFRFLLCPCCLLLTKASRLLECSFLHLKLPFCPSNPPGSCLLFPLVPTTLLSTSTQILFLQGRVFNPPGWVSSLVFSKDCISFFLPGYFLSL